MLDKYDEVALIDFLSKQQNVECDPIGKEVFLEIEPEPETDKFKIRINCEKTEENEKL